MKKKYFSVLFLFLILCARILASDPAVKAMKIIFNNIGNEQGKKITIVIDPGHGGRDPGKVGVNGALEKDINLEISLKLKKLLEQNNFNVIMTREEDIGLYSETDSNKKRTDLNNRINIINSSEAAFAVSIHQNSFGEEYVKGAQAFYHAESAEGKKLAEILQEQIKETIKDGNHRRAKSNTSYFMLKKTACPLVIVECGYLSNYNEASLLVKGDYQEKMAWAIHLGIMKYMNRTSS